MASGRRKLATAIKSASRREADRRSRDNQLAIVITVDPISIRLMDDGNVLDHDQFTMAHGVEQFHADYELEPGDNLVMHRSSGYWIAMQAISEKPATKKQDA